MDIWEISDKKTALREVFRRKEDSTGPPVEKGTQFLKYKAALMLVQTGTSAILKLRLS